MAQRGGDRRRRRAAAIAALVGVAAAVSSSGSASAVIGMAGADAIHVEVAALPGDFTITPSSGPTAGGTTVTISGSGAGRAITVQFGDATAVLPVVVNPDEITAMTPPQDAGNVEVELLFPGGVETVPGGFTYVEPLLASPPLAETGSGTAQISVIAAVLLLGGGAWALRWSRTGRR